MFSYTYFYWLEVVCETKNEDLKKGKNKGQLFDCFLFSLINVHPIDRKKSFQFYFDSTSYGPWRKKNGEEMLALNLYSIRPWLLLSPLPSLQSNLPAEALCVSVESVSFFMFLSSVQSALRLKCSCLAELT